VPYADLPVRPPSFADELTEAARLAGDDVKFGLDLAAHFGRLLPPPGGGETAARWAALIIVAEQDLTAARILEAHSDALAILAEAGEAAPDGTWGVFAAEAPQVRLDARDTGEDRAVLTGTKPWCSLGGMLDHALVTAHTDRGRGLYAVDLSDPTVTAEPPESWVARGLAHVTSGPVHFADTPARPIGTAGWYLERAGFAWGGIGVAACWYGGASALYTTLREASAGRDGDLPPMHVGAVDVALHGVASVLRLAADDVDSGRAVGRAGEMLALRVRSIVADAVEVALRQVGHALGPAPLAFDDAHARRVADLELYVRQHHGERDLATLGRAVLDAGRR
jgi:alkylation response protein AidB-like acyl-CoA dehydrogenase